LRSSTIRHQFCPWGARSRHGDVDPVGGGGSAGASGDPTNLRGRGAPLLHLRHGPPPSLSRRTGARRTPAPTSRSCSTGRPPRLLAPPLTQLLPATQTGTNGAGRQRHECDEGGWRRGRRHGGQARTEGRRMRGEGPKGADARWTPRGVTKRLVRRFGSRLRVRLPLARVHRSNARSLPHVAPSTPCLRSSAHPHVASTSTSPSSTVRSGSTPPAPRAVQPTIPTPAASRSPSPPKP
jgi:hypothetical protein